MTETRKSEHRVVINEGIIKRNLNPPPIGARPPAPKAQVAPPPQPPKKQEPN
jgi:hypothetical protein